MSSLIGFAKNLTATLLAEQKLVNELPTLMPNLRVQVGDTTLTCAQVVALGEQHISAEQQLASLKAQTRQAQANIKGLRTRMKAAGLQVKRAASAAFGNNSEEFQTLGFIPPKARKTTTAAEKALGAARNLATRVLRGTRGARQKAAIHGTVPAPARAAALAPAPVTSAVAK
jgi:hypothetical protein